MDQTRHLRECGPCRAAAALWERDFPRGSRVPGRGAARQPAADPSRWRAAGERRRYAKAAATAKGQSRDAATVCACGSRKRPGFVLCYRCAYEVA